MEQFLSLVWDQVVGRADGPMWLRLIVQPLVATILGVKAGLGDARTGHAPYLWTVLSNPGQRRHLVSEGFKDVAKVFMLALVLEVVYELIVFRWVYPLQALLVAVVLAIIPYTLIRGPVTRVAARMRTR